MTERYLFVERDGGLIERPAAGSDPVNGVRLQADCIRALQRFVETGYRIVVLVDPAAADESDRANRLSQDFVEALFASQGIDFDAVRQCIHPVGTGCDCALPGIGLVADYVGNSELDRRRSLIVGGPQATTLGRAMGLSGFEPDQATGWLDIAHTAIDLPRRASVVRKTRETDIRVDVDLDRTAEPSISTGIGFFDHMLEQLGKHGGFELSIVCDGDLEVDEHHTIEDVALALGQALREALGDKRGITRYGFLLPMDEAEAQVAIDLSGRAYAVFEGSFPRDSVGGMPTELVGHFFRSLSETLGAALHISVRGDNAHHMVEACFKCVARALRQALARSGSELPSTKGAL